MEFLCVKQKNYSTLNALFISSVWRYLHPHKSVFLTVIDNILNLIAKLSITVGIPIEAAVIKNDTAKCTINILSCCENICKPSRTVTWYHIVLDLFWSNHCTLSVILNFEFNKVLKMIDLGNRQKIMTLVTWSYFIAPYMHVSGNESSSVTL